MKTYKLHKLTLLILLTVSVLGCESVVLVDLPEHESKLVVNSFLDPEQFLNVHVSTSTDIFDPVNAGERKLTDAEVLIYEDGQFLDTLHYMQFMFIDSNQNEHKVWGYLSLTHKPRTGHAYQLKVSYPEYEQATGHSFVPESPEPYVTGVDFEFDVFRDPFDGDIVSKLVLQLDNPNTGDHYYGIRTWVAFQYRGADGSIMQDYSEIDFQKTYEGGLVEEKFQDESFFKLGKEDPAGQREPHLLGELHGDLTVEAYPELHFLGVYMELKSCGQTYYDYLVQLKQQLQSQENDIPLFGGEPVTVHSNISGGYGIFGAFAKARFSLPL